jgi:hypothetical protein
MLILKLTVITEQLPTLVALTSESTRSLTGCAKALLLAYGEAVIVAPVSSNAAARRIDLMKFPLLYQLLALTRW